MRTVPRPVVWQLVERLGFDPAAVASIYITPHELVVETREASLSETDDPNVADRYMIERTHHRIVIADPDPDELPPEADVESRVEALASSWERQAASGDLPDVELPELADELRAVARGEHVG